MPCSMTAAAVQADRLSAARQLAARFQCVVVLKGSGTVIASPDHGLMVNASGNAILATAGTGDVLAGMVGALLASGMRDFQAACSAVFTHGYRADTWSSSMPACSASTVRSEALRLGICGAGHATARVGLSLLNFECLAIQS